MARGKRTIETLNDADVRIQRIEATLHALKMKFETMDPPAIEAATRAMNEEAGRIHSTMGVMILKLSVVTEVPRYLRKRDIPPNLYVPKLLPLFDLPDAWWRRHMNMSMDGWCELIANAEVETAA